MVHAAPQIRSHAREMRSQPTKPEALLWYWLRDRKFGDYKFRRQHPIGDYILDSYCAELKLAIELDGAYHDFVAEYDQMRTTYIERQGIILIRIENEAFAGNADGVGDSIRWAIEQRT